MIENYSSENSSNITTRVITAHIPVDLASQLDQFAERNERSKAWVIKEALTTWLELEKKRYNMTLEGLNAVKSGKVISHKKIENWAKNLGKTK